METLTEVMDDLHSGPRHRAEFHSALDKSSAALLCLSRPPRVSRRPLTVARAGWSITQPIVPAPSAWAPLALAFPTGRACTKVSAELRDAVPPGVLRCPPVSSGDRARNQQAFSRIVARLQGIHRDQRERTRGNLHIPQCRSCARADPYSRAHTRAARQNN